MLEARDVNRGVREERDHLRAPESVSVVRKLVFGHRNESLLAGRRL